MALTQQDKEEMYQYLITRGKGLGSLDEGDSNLSNKYLAPVLEYSGGTASKAVRLAVSLLQGKSAVLRKSGDLVQWQLQGASIWETLYSMADYKGLPGANGKNPVFRKNAANLEYKLDGEEDTAYKLLVALSEITGPEGDHVELRVQDGKLEYKQSKAADSTYQELLIIEDMRGPQGRPGKDFQILGYYDTIADLRTAITSPEPGEAYGVGTAAPYPIYIWDAVSQDWVNNGAIQGPAGRSGKSARVNTDTGYWEEFDDNTQTWKQTEALGVYNIATSEKDGLMSKDDKAKLDQMKGGDIEVSKANIEKVLTGNITTHTHDTERIVTGMPTDVWDGVTVSTALAGSGTVDDPYLIQSCADYIHFYRNPRLYSHTFENEPSEEQMTNLKQVKFTSHLDFNNHSLDFESTIMNPNMAGDPDMDKILVLINIDGQGCYLSNLNFLNTWAVFPLSMYCSIKNIHIISGIFTIPLSLIHDKEFQSNNNSNNILTPWGLLAAASIVEDVSFVAEVKFKGDIETIMMFVFGVIVISGMANMFPGVTIGGTPCCYSNVTYSVDEGLSSLVGVQHVSAYVARGDNPISVTCYDCTKSLKDTSVEPTQGLAVLMVVDASETYTLYINTDNALPFYNSSSTTPFHTAKTTAEMKSLEFLALLNGDTETFVADTENVNDGYPIFKPNQVVQKIYGYVKESTFEAFKNNMPVGGSDNVYNLDIDISGQISTVDADVQIQGWGRTYTAPTNDNIIELLGGTEGIRQLCEKLAPASNPVVTVPFLAVYFPARLASSVIMFSITDSNMSNQIPLSDGCLIIIGLCFNILMNNELNAIEVAIQISNFNTSTQSAAYSYSIKAQGGSAESTEVLDYLTSTNTRAALSANQGRVLKGLIDNFSGTTVENSLTSSSTTNALSAAQGKALKTLVDGKVGSSEITTIKKLTQSAYDALSSKDSKTLYVIV